MGDLHVKNYDERISRSLALVLRLTEKVAEM